MLLDTAQVADLLNITERAVRKNARNGKYGQVKYVDGDKGGGSGGQILKIPLYNLPVSAIATYLEQENHDDGIYRPYSAGDFSAWAREEAVKKKKMLDMADKLVAEFREDEGLGKTAALKKACKIVKSTFEDMPFSTKTYYRDRRIYKEEGIVGLMDKRGLKKEVSQEEETPSQVNENAWWFFLKLYLDENGPSLSECWRMTKTRAKVKGWGKIPSRRSFQRYVKDPRYVRPEVVIGLREGPTALKNKAEPYIERDLGAIDSNEVWVGDHRQFDVFVRTEDGSVKAPWLTAWLDMRSGLFVGYTISLNPNLNTIMESFGSALGEYGAPEHIYIDNGKDYRACQFAGGRITEDKKEIKYDKDLATSMVEALDITPHFAIPFNARAKIIEPKFRHVKEYFDRKFKTFRGGNVQERKESLNTILKKKKDIIPLEEFKEIWDRWVDVDYHERPQSGKAMNDQCPRVVYKKNLKKTRWVSQKDIAFLMTKAQGTRVVQRNGVRLFNRHYKSDELMEYFKQKVLVRYDSNDLSKVYICDLEDRFLCTAQAIEAVHPIHATEDDLKGLHKERKKMQKAVEETKGRLAQVENYDLEDYLRDKEKEKRQAVAQEEPQEDPKVVEMIKPHFHESVKNFDKEEDGQAYREVNSGQNDETVAQMQRYFREEYQKKVNTEDQRKEDMKNLKKVLGLDF